MQCVKWMLCTIVWAAVAVSDSTATQLIFEPASGSFVDFAVLPQGYGNRVISTIQDGFKYSLDGGATPNVVTQYGAPAGLVDLFTWAEDYGDLHHIIFAREPVQFEMRLVADPGFRVTLNSFDMAGWPHLDFPSIASVSIEDGAGHVLFSQSDVFIHGDVNGPQHTHFSFSGVSASELRIKFDSRTDGHGTTLDSDDVGIDNISFSQSMSPVCDIQLNTTTFVNGDQVIAQVLRIANPAATPLALEFKFWFEVPGMAPISFARGGADGSVVLAAGFTQNFGPLPLFTVTSAFPRGAYAFNCRFLHPVTGGLQAEDLNPFTIP